MGRPKKRYVCQACGSVLHRWQGQCPDCAEWNTLVEDVPATVFSQKHDLSSGGQKIEFVPLDVPGRPFNGDRRSLRSSTAHLVAGLCRVPQC
jgi:DNA repair protein RadA/Sms